MNSFHTSAYKSVCAMFTILFGLAIYSGATHSQSALPSGVAATVNGTVISNDAVEQGIQAALSQGQKDSPELRNLVLSKLIEIALLSQQADRDGLANSEKANAQLAQLRQSYLANLELSSFMASNPVTDADIEAEYQRQVASLGPQGNIVEYKVSDIAVASEADARSALARLKKGEPFDKVAKAISLAPNNIQGGAIGWVQAGQVAPQIATVLSSLSKGQVAPAPIQMPQGWFLIKLDDKRTSKPPTLDQAKPAIRAGLAQKKQFDYLNQLRQAAQIVIQ